MTSERAIVITNAAGQRLVGVWHGAETAKARATVISLHGWSGYRSGPHQMLTRAARQLAGAGFNVLRFDFAGRGDSEGNAEQATLATMADDAAAAIRWCREDTSSETPIVLQGLCSGCEVAVAASGVNKVSGLALWSAPVFAASQSQERTARKRTEHLKQYARKLLRPATYVKILTGRVDTRSVKQVMAHSGGEAKNVETGAVGQLPRGWRAAALQTFQATPLPTLLIYGTADPTTEEALQWHREHLKVPPQVHLITGANHSYYGLNWEKDVIETTQRWLEERW